MIVCWIFSSVLIAIGVGDSRNIGVTEGPTSPKDQINRIELHR